MENVKQLTVDDILSGGARVRVSFHHCGDLQTAYNKIKPYRHLGKVNRHQMDGTIWLYINHENIDVTAFL